MEMVKFTTKNKIIIIACVVIILCSVLSIRLLCQNKEKSEALLPASNGVICFYEQTNDPNIVAIGMIVKNESSIVFLWNKTANTTEIEIDYKPVTEEECQVFKTIVEKGVISEWTGNRIVPCNIRRLSNDTSLNKTYPYPISNDTYYVYYYDGYGGHWSYGGAFFYLNNQTIVWDIHVM